MVAQHTMGSRRHASGMPWLSDSLQPEKRCNTHTGVAQWQQKCSDLGRMPTSFDGK